MKDQLTPGESQLLWMLASQDAGNGANEEVLRHGKSANEKLNREGLVKRGFILAGKQGRKIHLKMADAGWEYCNTSLGWTLPAGQKSKADMFLHWLMPRLKKIFEDSSSPANFSDFVNKSAPLKPPEAEQPIPVKPKPKPKPKRPSKPHKNPETLKEAPHVIVEAAAPAPANHTADVVERAVRTACLDLAGGRRAVRVRIADIRKHLPEFSDDDVTAALWDLSERKELTMFRLDDPQQLTPEDHRAAVRSTLGQMLHIVYFGGTPS